MAINKVVYGNQTLIDITDTTASATSVQSGKKFYDKSGSLITGVGSALGHTTEILPNNGVAHYITGIDLGEDTVDASHLSTGYTAHDKNGTIITGTLDGGPLKMGVLRPDAELIQTFSYDKMWVEDDERTIPAYTGSATTIHSGTALTPTVVLNFSNYKYYILIRCITIPKYNTTIKEKGRPDYSMTSAAYEIIDITTNMIQTTTKSTISSRSNIVAAAGSVCRMPYWTSESAAALYTATSYGLHQTPAAPTLSSATTISPTLTIKDPNLIIRGSSTYLSSSAWGKLIDIRRQYVIEVYRVSRFTELKGWNLYSQFNHIVDCVNNHNFVLT